MITEEKVSFKSEDDNVLNRIKKMLNRKLDSKPVYDEKYIKAKTKTFNDIVNLVFSGGKIPNESIHYICKAAI